MNEPFLLITNTYKTFRQLKCPDDFELTGLILWEEHQIYRWFLLFSTGTIIRPNCNSDIHYKNNKNTQNWIWMQAIPMSGTRLR